MINFIEKRGWEIFNENIKGDEEGEFTFSGGRGRTVIDYVLGEEKMREKIDRIRICDEVESDHQPIEVYIRKEEEGKKRRDKVRKKVRRSI